MEFREVLQRVSYEVNMQVTPKHVPKLDHDYDPEAPSLPLKPKDEIYRFVDSLTTVAIASHLKKVFSKNMPNDPGFFFHYPSIELIAGAIHQGVGDAEALKPEHVDPFPPKDPPSTHERFAPKLMPFSQLINDEISCRRPRHLETSDGILRQSDGMQCILIPSADVHIGGGTKESARYNEQPTHHEQPTHPVRLSSFLMDVEPVSVGAYVRFLNLATPPPTEAELLEWCMLEPNDPRKGHMIIVRQNDKCNKWQVKENIPPNWPMILVSWYGANAYSLWAHGGNWQDYKSSIESFLPTEAQWEYAARGTDPQDFPWGQEQSADLLNVCWDAQKHLENGLSPPAVHELPLDPVNLTKGQSPFGLRGMAGNVWQWCRDTYDPDFYSSSMAVSTDAWNSTEGPLAEECDADADAVTAEVGRFSRENHHCPTAKQRIEEHFPDADVPKELLKPDELPAEDLEAPEVTPEVPEETEEELAKKVEVDSPQVRRQKQEAVAREDYDRAMELKELEKQLENQRQLEQVHATAAALRLLTDSSPEERTLL
eukprot:Skav217280  [mRNA]  locus=scaffold120:199839:206828:+ [translate_table: standard]